LSAQRRDGRRECFVPVGSPFHLDNLTSECWGQVFLEASCNSSIGTCVPGVCHYATRRKQGLISSTTLGTFAQRYRRAALTGPCNGCRPGEQPLDKPCQLGRQTMGGREYGITAVSRVPRATAVFAVPHVTGCFLSDRTKLGCKIRRKRSVPPFSPAIFEQVTGASSIPAKLT